MAARQQIVVELVDKVSRSLRSIEQRMKSLDGNTAKMSRGMNNAGVAAKAFVGALAVREVLQFGNAVLQTAGRFEEYRNQLRLITDNQYALDGTFRLLQDSARATRSEFGDTVDLFQKLTLATKDMGVSQESVLRVTERFQKALAVSGADANTASGAIRQLGQAMASGQVRGDEFNSIVEALGPALNIMAEQTGVNVGELRKLAQSGQLTAKRFYEMLEASTAIDEAFGKTEQTVAQAQMALDQAFDEFIVEVSEAIGLTEAYKNSVSGITTAFRFMTTVLRGAKVEMEDVNEALELGETIRATQMLNDRLVYLTRNMARLGMTADEIEAEMTILVGLMVDIQRGAYDTAKGIQTTSNAMSDLDLAMAALKPYEGLIKRVMDTDSVYEMADAVGKAQMDLRRLESAERALRQVMLESNEVTLEQRIQLRGVTEAIIVQRAKLAELTAEQRNNNSTVSQSVKFYNNLIASASRSANETVYQQQAVSQLNKDLRSGKISLDVYAAAMDSLGEGTKAAAVATVDYADKLDQLEDKYAEFLGETVDRAKDAYDEDLEMFKTLQDKKLISAQRYNQLKSAADRRLHNQTIRLTQQETAFTLSEIEKRVQAQVAAGNYIMDASDAATVRKIHNATKEQDIEAKKVANLIAFEKDRVGFTINSLADSMKAIGQHNRAAFKAYKAFAIAKTLMDTYASARAAFLSVAHIPIVGVPLGIAAAAAAVAAGLATVNQIRSMQYTGYAQGGEMTVNRPAVVGENGPEIIVPKNPSVVMPNSVKERLGDGKGGPVTVNFNITTLDARDFDTMLIERRATITGIINDAMVRRGKVGVY